MLACIEEYKFKAIQGTKFQVKNVTLSYSTGKKVIRQLMKIILFLTCFFLGCLLIVVGERKDDDEIRGLE